MIAKATIADQVRQSDAKRPNISAVVLAKRLGCTVQAVYSTRHIDREKAKAKQNVHAANGEAVMSSSKVEDTYRLSDLLVIKKLMPHYETTDKLRAAIDAYEQLIA